MEVLKLQYQDPVGMSIDYLRQFEPEEGYWLANSYGKDSIVVEDLCKVAGVKYESHHCHTSADHPKLIYFGRKYYPDTIVDKSEWTMWNIIPVKGVSTRIRRFCCSYLKERGGEGRFTITGVRKAESANRRKNRGLLETFAAKKEDKILFNDNDDDRKIIEICAFKGKRVLNPIIHWSDEDVWNYIKSRNLPYCSLYDEGYKRLGCIGCPMSYNRVFELKQNPKYYNAYLRAFDRLIQNRLKTRESFRWKTAQDVMNWWIYEMPKQEPGQMELEFDDED